MSQRAEALLGQPLLDAAALDLAAAGRLTYILRQTFTYSYDRPALDVRQRLVVIPKARHGSAHRLLHRLTVSEPGVAIRSYRQPGGNVVAIARLPVVPQEVQFTLEAVVERRGAYADAVLPRAAATDSRWLRPTRLTTPDDAVRDLTVGLSALSPLEIGDELCARVHAAMPYEFGVTSTSTTAAEALATGRGVCQDHAHVMLAACHSLGLPARYVSGHLLGEGGTHAWVEVLVAEATQTRAVALDPCNGYRADARYLTVATGRDYSDVAPTSGTYAGDALGQLRATKQVGVAEAA